MAACAAAVEPSGSRPNPRVMARKSILSGVMDQTKSLMQVVGAEDKARLEQYFTGLRDLEHQFDLQPGRLNVLLLKELSAAMDDFEDGHVQCFRPVPLLSQMSSRGASQL